jgi:tRNA A-37 threonylcarbamoyl transferase component Bud32
MQLAPVYRSGAVTQPRSAGRKIPDARRKAVEPEATGDAAKDAGGASEASAGRGSSTSAGRSETPATPAEDEPRRILGRYRMEKRIASGGMAEVWRAHDEILGRPVAVKLLHQHLLLDAATRQRFEREARAAAGLSHPGIVGIYDVAVSADEAAIVMEYVPGETLSHILVRRGRLPQIDSVDLAVQVAGALEHAHSRGVIHRDLKPDNILVGVDGRALLLDFGIARTVEAGSARLTTAGTVVGTLRYMSPEQLAGEAGDERTDVFGLGSTLYQMLAGRPPFDAEAPVALLEQQRQRPPAIAGVPAELMAVVWDALEHDPARRLPSAARLGGRLRGWLVGAARETGENARPSRGSLVPVLPPDARDAAVSADVAAAREPRVQERAQREAWGPAAPGEVWVRRDRSRRRSVLMGLLVIGLLLAGAALLLPGLSPPRGRPGAVPANAETAVFEATQDARIALVDGSEVGAGGDETLPVGEYDGFLYRSLVQFEPDWRGMSRIYRIELRLTSTSSVKVRRDGSASTLVRRNTDREWQEGNHTTPSPRNAVTWANAPEMTEAGQVSFEGPAGSNEAITIDITALYLPMAPHTLGGQREADLGLTLLAASDDGRGASGGDTNEFWSSEAGERGPQLIVSYAP